MEDHALKGPYFEKKRRCEIFILMLTTSFKLHTGLNWTRFSFSEFMSHVQTRSIAINLNFFRLNFHQTFHVWVSGAHNMILAPVVSQQITLKSTD